MKSNRAEIWTVLWIEWIYALFLRTFDLRTSLVLWDLLFMRGNELLFQLAFIVFYFLDLNLKNINFSDLH